MCRLDRSKKKSENALEWKKQQGLVTDQKGSWEEVMKGNARTDKASGSSGTKIILSKLEEP